VSYIVFDARMLSSSGIGRYARDALRVLERQDLRLSRLSPRIPPYSPLTQIALPFLVPPCDLFFSPHITTTRLPLPARRRLLTVHDAFHLSELAPLGRAERAYARFLYAGALQGADAVIAVSEFTRSEIARLFPRQAHKVTVVLNAVDGSVFRPDPVRAPVDGPYVLFVGNMKAHKNLVTAARAVELQADPDLRLVVVGQSEGFLHGMGGELEELRRSRRLLFFGHQEDGALRRLYSHAECLLFPSLYEGFGYPPLEALACGTPAICSSLPPTRETCAEAALYANPRSAESFAHAIDLLRTDGSLRNRLLAAGAERVRLFSLNAFEAGTLAVVNRLLDRGS
jgi:glycosyltransferase involved in cell wall biosynthesis